MISISLCMIVKNEEANLTNCLGSIVGQMDEIIIVDTGSSDKTKEIALRFTDKVYDFPWVNDFAAARNYSISKASNEFILVVDCDELIESIDLPKIKELASLNQDKIGRVQRINEYTRGDNLYLFRERVNRFFSKKFFRYEGIIHEQVVPITPGETATYNLPLVMRHFGYEGDLETRKKKTERNITLLKYALQNNPEDPYLYYQLGKSYYMQEDYQSACEWFEKALYFDLNPNLEYVQDMVESYGYALINTKQYETAMQLSGVYEEFAVNADFVFLMGLIYMNNERFEEAISEFHKATRIKEFKVEGVNSYRAFYNIGVIYECLGAIDKAKMYYQKCKDYEPARSRLADYDKIPKFLERTPK